MTRRRARRLTYLFVTFGLLAGFGVPVSAQTKPSTTSRAPAGSRVDISVGAGFLGGSSLGDADAVLRGPGGGSFELFGTSSRMTGSVPVDVRVGFPLTPRYAIEVRGVWARPELQTAIAGDVEGAPALTVAERVDLYSLDVGLLVTFSESRPRVIAPFLSGGVGMVGAVHEGLTLLEKGVIYRGGGGVKYPLTPVRTGRRLKGIGLRADAALVIMTGGVVSGSGATRQVVASGSVYLAF